MSWVPANGSPSQDGHILGGSQSIVGAISPNSGKPLLQLAQLDTADRRLELETASFAALPLLYSWTCEFIAACSPIASSRIESSC